MRKIVAILSIGTLAGGIIQSPVVAADYNSGIVTKSPTVDYTDVEFGSGWYIRGDITYNIDGESNSSFKTINTDNGPFSVQADYDDAVGARIGAGYYLSPNLRLEATAEAIFNSKFNGTQSRSFGGSRNVSMQVETDPGGPYTDPDTGITSENPPTYETFTDEVHFDRYGNVTGSENGNYTTYVGNSIAANGGSETIDASYDASVFAASAYMDIPVSVGFTPYIGAGIGAGRVSYTENRTYRCVPGSEASCSFPVAGGQGETVEASYTLDDEYWAFVYQIHAGAAFAIDDKMSLDVGYTYTAFDDGELINYDDGIAIDRDGFALHQVRAGLRYDIW